MSLKVLDKKKNPLFKREEIKATFEHVGKPTPTRDDILPLLEKSLGSKKDMILIDKIFSVKGKGESALKVFVYSKKEDIPKEKLELIQKRSEKKKAKKPEGSAPAPGAEAKQGEAKPAEGEVKEEGPKEETSEEKPAEETKEKVKEEPKAGEKKEEEKRKEEKE